ncbi:uncharacterized protein LTR77_008103 [Saxophila tyrrhenica]|uniref:SRPBCC domain-containing protein n=1 Tax=Saxophila tyrrhenica TaxID=1690608 RepID=A0AAV9P1T7_9PEZI|nr:hypothetical protein LTR77_008103 [Saxophila tyrrhenica]
MVHTEILETPSIKADQAVWTSYGSATINKPADTVWRAIRDFRSWKVWNEYTPEVTTKTGTNEVAVGDQVTVHYRPEPTGTISQIPCTAMTVSDAERTLCWRGEPFGVPAWLLLPEKVQRVTPKGDDSCLYEIFETQSGPMSYLVKWGMGAKQSAMNQGIADALRRYAEGESGNK